MVGVAGGLLALEIPTLGWLILVLFAVPAVIVGPRVAAVGGMAIGVGASWLILLGRVAVTCRATGEEVGCQAPDIGPWLVFGAVVLAIGLGLTAVALVRAKASTTQ